MTDPMPEAVTGDLIRWVRQTLSAACAEGGADEETTAWVAELEALAPRDGLTVVDIGALSPGLRGFLGTLADSSLSPDLDPEAVEPAVGPEQYAWGGDNTEESEGSDAVAPGTGPEGCSDRPEPHVADGLHAILLIDFGPGSTGETEREVLHRRLEAVITAAARLTGWDDDLVNDWTGDRVVTALPVGARAEAVGRWFRLLAPEVPRHVPSSGLALWMRDRRAAGSRLPPLRARSRGWSRGADPVPLGRLRTDWPLVVVDAEVFPALGDADGRVLGIGPERWRSVQGGPERPAYRVAPWPGGARAAVAGRTQPQVGGRWWRSPEAAVPAGVLPERVLREMADLARELAGELAQVRVAVGGSGAGRPPKAGPSGVPQDLAAETADLATGLGLLAGLTGSPAPAVLREASGRASEAAQLWSEFLDSGRGVDADHAEQALFRLVLGLGAVLEPGGPPPVTDAGAREPAAPPGPPQPPAPLRRSTSHVTRDRWSPAAAAGPGGARIGKEQC
ncbi:hypothetical protein ABZW10_19300 [Kitasatospora sp. NPDC004723]|uniref:hypothetical protein n=1 Tax=Kitasatospora sp. NPDC004723 TaxID=3154288 RepID=UPI00339FF563